MRHIEMKWKKKKRKKKKMTSDMEAVSATEMMEQNRV